MIDFFEPCEILRKYIKSYYIVEMNNPLEFLPKTRVYPNGNINLVFHYGAPSKFKKKGSCEYVESNLVVCGQQTSYYDVSLSGNTAMILVIFKPHGVKSFFRFPISELKDENLSLQELIKNDAIEFEGKLSEAANNQERIFLLESFLLKKLLLNKDFERIEYAVKRIENTKGQIKAQALAQEVCLGLRQFERIFLNYVGLNPKKYMSIVRFQSVLQMKKNSHNAKMYQLALDNGYYDQAHFVHDFKSLTGLSPKTFFNKEK